jgi:hypothetical protein
VNFVIGVVIAAGCCCLCIGGHAVNPRALPRWLGALRQGRAAGRRC